MSTATGEIIRTIRRKQGKTQLDIARACNCTVSFLSKLEHDRTKASLNMLHRIATALQVNISTLLPVAAGRGSRIVRAGERPIVNSQTLRPGEGIHLEMVSLADLATIFQVNLHHISPGCRSDGLITHEGEEFIYILEGSIDLHLGSQTHRLEHGDAAFFPSSEPHGYANPADVPATVLWLNSPPTY